LGQPIAQAEAQRDVGQDKAEGLSRYKRDIPHEDADLQVLLAEQAGIAQMVPCMDR
jgi:hypothetical protein